jgi:hypothetical protein
MRGQTIYHGWNIYTYRAKVHPYKEIFFRLMDGLHPDTGRQYWISEQATEVNTCDMGEDMGHTETEVKIALPMSRNNLTSAEEDILR